MRASICRTLADGSAELFKHTIPSSLAIQIFLSASSNTEFAAVGGKDSALVKSRNLPLLNFPTPPRSMPTQRFSSKSWQRHETILFGKPFSSENISGLPFLIVTIPLLVAAYSVPFTVRKNSLILIPFRYSASINSMSFSSFILMIFPSFVPSHSMLSESKYAAEKV